jgi:hypothetical protein
MLEYRILTNNHTDILEREVNDLIKEGWRPLGGVSVAYKHEHAHNLVSHLVYLQSMVKGE